MMTTHLLIFATSNLHQAAWQALLESQPGIVVAGAAGNLEDLSRVWWQPPSAVLVDVPGVQTDLVSKLRLALPDCGLLLLVDSYELKEIVNLLRAGATGFMAHDATVADLARGIIAVGRGEIVLPPEMATQALLALAREKEVPEEITVSLTDREQDVLNLLAQGQTNKDIAQTLFLSVRTVEAHLRNIYGKLNVASRTEAAIWAVNHDYGAKE